MTSITYENLVAEIEAMLAGFGLRSTQRTFLAAGIGTTDVSMTTISGGATNLSGRTVEIDYECIDILSDDGSQTLQITPDGRGFQGTVAATHAANARIIVDPPFPKWRISEAINETLDYVYPTIFGVGSATFTFNPAVHNYQLPANATGILKVVAETFGPTKRQIELSRYVFNAAAAQPEFTTGRSITLNEFPGPGRTVTVTYMQETTAIGPGNLFTDSGLTASAKACITYGALARLITTTDLSRSLTNSATEYEFGAVGTNRVGIGQSIVQEVQARFQSELDSERRELNRIYPKRVRISGRF